MSPPDDDAKIRPWDFSWVDGAEEIIRYGPHGYHPVMIDDVLHDRYLIVDKLGWGGYSTIWLAHDQVHKEYVAVKVGISIPNVLSQETKCLRALSAPSPHPGHNAIPTPLDEFEIHGPNGTHPCYTMLPAGCNLQEVSYSDMYTLDVARALIGGLTMAVSHVHSCGYVHGDIRLSNVLFKNLSSLNHLSVEQFREEYGEPDAHPIEFRKGEPLPPGVPPKAIAPFGLGPAMAAKHLKLHDAHILLSDFGESYSPSSETRRGKDCHTPIIARPPEANFEPQAPLSYSADIWCLALAIWDIFAMKPPFSNGWVTEDDTASEHIDVLGPMPTRWWDGWEARGEYFEQDQRPKQGRFRWPKLEEAFDGDCVQEFRQEVGVFGEEERGAILHLMRRMLTFEPKERPTVDEVLESEWMVKWVLPDWERARNDKAERQHTSEYVANADDVGEDVQKLNLANSDDGEGMGNRESVGKEEVKPQEE